MNPPAVKGIKKAVKLGILDPINRVKIAPNNDVNAVRKLKNNALLLCKPANSKTPKSPNSCGISCKMTAKVVVIPNGIETR